jgi:hypothetical protein
MAQLWKTWNILRSLEQASSNRQAAQAAWQQAVRLFLAYRREGGENRSGTAYLCLAVEQAIQQESTARVWQQIAYNLQEPIWQEHKNFLYKLQAILAGERDLSLTEDESLHYEATVELLLLLEQLQEAGI